jgi:hypothetical protein
MKNKSQLLFLLIMVLTLCGWNRSARAMLTPQLGRFLQQDPLGYVDGMNRYLEISANPINQLDPSGKAATSTGPASQPATTSQPCQCICASEPDKCSIQVQWSNSMAKGADRKAAYYPNNSTGKYSMKFQLFTTVKLVHSEGNSLQGCHLTQDIERHQSYGDQKDLKISGDYSSKADGGGKNTVYHDTWFEDAPGIVNPMNDRPKA